MNNFFNNSNFEDDLVENSATLIPVCLCLDTSSSMRGKPIEELNKGIKLFYETIKNDEISCMSTDLSIVTFGNGGVKSMYDFSNLNKNPNPPELKAGGNTPMGDAVNKALDMIENRRDEYHRKGIDHYKPWLVIMTDGHPFGDSSKTSLPTAQRRATELVNNNKLGVFPIWIGNNNQEKGMSILAGFSPKNKPAKLKGIDFSKFFDWLSKSVSSASSSNSESDIRLAPLDWVTM